MPFTTTHPGSTLRSKVLLGFGTVMVMLVLIATISVQSTRGFSRSSLVVAGTYETIEVRERMLRQLVELDGFRRDYLARGDDRLLRNHKLRQTELLQSLNALRVLSNASPEEGGRLDELEAMLTETYTVQRRQMEAWRDATMTPRQATELENANDVGLAKIRKTIGNAQQKERDLLAERADLNDRIASSNIAAIVSGSFLTIVALLIAGVLILQDLRARQRAEEALAQEHNLLSSIINALPNHVYVKDAKGRFILDNSAHRGYLGLDDSQSVEGKTDFDYFAPEVAARFEEDDQHVMESGEPMLGNEEEAALSDDRLSDTWLESNKVPLRDTDGKIVGLVGISWDISARKHDEEKLRRFAGQLERSNAELANFASVASHDLQEPLRKIQAFGDRLKAKCSEGLGEQGRDYLARMQNAAGRMQTLIQDLLKLSRITSRAQPFEKCDLTEILNSVLSDLEIAIEQKNAHVRADPLPTIAADPLQMRQLFQNLVANALKFQQPGVEPIVTITSQVFTARERLGAGTLAGDQVCRIRISDNGIGFDAKFAEQIFVVFQRLHSREEYEGTGIGLAVCRKITDRHGGTIVAKSEPGQGATFEITLPVQQSFSPSP